MRKIIFDKYLGEDATFQIIDGDNKEIISVKYKCCLCPDRYAYYEYDKEEEKDKIFKEQYMAISSYIGKNISKLVGNNDAFIERENIVIKGNIFDSILADMGLKKYMAYDLTHWMVQQGILIPDKYGCSKRTKFIDKRIQRCAVIRLDYQFYN